MNLLIVDDQTSVVNGLMYGIMWNIMGIEHVFPAYNAKEAKEILTREEIQIMLCDIEMPVENGISLLRWVREQGNDLECIFLTAHAEFRYAKDAVHMGGFDYILQPAPYEEIQKAVYQAVQKVIEKLKQKKVYAYGKAVMNQNQAFCAVVIKELIHNSLNRSQYEKYWQVVPLPGWEQSCHAFLFEILEEQEVIQKFGESLMQFAIDNVCRELFSGYGQEVILHSVNSNLYFVVIFGIEGYHMDDDGMLRQTELIRKNMKKFFGMKIACYTTQGVSTFRLSESYEGLIRIRDKNVVGKEGVLAEEDFPNREYEYQMVAMKRWKAYMSQDLKETAREEMKQYLNQLAERGQIDRYVLYHFHMDLIRAIGDVLEENRIQPHEIMNQIEHLNLYQDSTSSLQNMLSFTDELIDLLIKNQGQGESGNIIEKAKRYIQDNLEKDVKRADVAVFVHLNPDYLNRVFKKETGMPVTEYIIWEKMEVARNLIKTTMLPVSIVALKTGYDNFSYFSRIYKKIFGISPSEERKKV